MDGEWDGLQGTFSGGEVTYTKELKHGLIKHWCVHYSKRRAAGISKWEWSGSKGLWAMPGSSNVILRLMDTQPNEERQASKSDMFRVTF